MPVSNQATGRPLSTPGRQTLEAELRALMIERRRAESQRSKAIREAWMAEQTLQHSWPRFLALCADLGMTTCEAEEHLMAHQAQQQAAQTVDFTAEVPVAEVRGPKLGVVRDPAGRVVEVQR